MIHYRKFDKTFEKNHFSIFFFKIKSMYLLLIYRISLMNIKHIESNSHILSGAIEGILLRFSYFVVTACWFFCLCFDYILIYIINIFFNDLIFFRSRW